MPIREIGASITMDASSFKKEMSAVNSNLSGLQSEMKAVTAEFADNTASADALAAKDKILAQQQEQQKVKVDALTRAYEEQVAATGENSVEADKLRKQLNNARADLAKTESQLKKNTQALEDATKKESQYVPANEKAARAVQELREKVEEKVKALQDAAKHTPVVAEGLAALGAAGKAAGKGLEISGKAMGAATKAAAGLAAAGLAATGAVAGLAISGMKTLAGWAAEAAQAVDENGEVLNKDFAKLAENLTGLNTGADAAKMALSKALLPALESLSGKGSALLNNYVKALEGAEGDTSKMGAITAEYIEEGVKVIQEELPNLIRLGGDLLGGLVDGLTMNMDEILSAGEEILTTLLDAILKFAPDLADAALQLITSLGAFLIENAPELLASGMELVATLIQGLTAALPQLIPMAAKMIVQLVTGLASNLPQMVKMGLDLILAIVQGLGEALPQLLAAVPGIIEELIGGFQAAWSDIKGIGKKIIDGILEGLKEAWGAVKSWFSGVVGGLTGTAHVSVATDGSHAGGLDYVPFDGYIAELHKGEQVLTASEAAAYRGGGGGGRVVNVNVSTAQLSPSTVDYLVRRVNQELGGDVT